MCSFWSVNHAGIKVFNLFVAKQTRMIAIFFQILMMTSALSLYSRYEQQDESLPVFSWLLFARDTSRDPEMLFHNHINTVGDTGGLEQVRENSHSI